MLYISKHLIQILILIPVVFNTEIARAWKIDVHIWIAQQVLNDARDGSITFKIGNKTLSLQLDESYKRALRNHPKSFLLGSIGPDAFPDAFTGQLVIHPAVKDGWGTSEWLQHLLVNGELSDEELAFALGYLTHASADIFAHTFVNRYAGDVFELLDHEWAAIRHIHIESLVSNYLPPVIDSQSGVSQTAADAVRSSDKLSIPEDFIIRKFLMNESAVAQYRKSKLVPHLVAAYDLHKSLDKFLSDEGLLIEIEALVIKLLAAYYLEIDISIEQAKELQKLSNKINAELNDESKKASEILKGLNDEISKIEGFQIEMAEKGLHEAIKFSNRLADIQIEILGLDRELIKLNDDISRINKHITRQITDKICDFFGGLFGSVKKICRDVTRTVTEISDEWNGLNIAIKAKQEALETIKSEKDNLEPKLRDAVRSGFDTVRELHEQKRITTNQLIAYLETNPFGPPHRVMFEQWRDSIPVALVRFTEANAEAIVNSIDPKNPSIFDPLIKWFLCYGPSFVSIPAHIGETGCVVWGGLKKVKMEFDEFEKKVTEPIPILNETIKLKQDIEAKIQELKDDVFSDVIIAGLSEFDKIANTNSTHIFKGLTQHVDIEKVNSVMSVDKNGQNLPIIVDAGERVVAEMSVKNGIFDPNNFNAVYNSVVLSKLAMLDQERLKELSSRMGLQDTRFGPNLFSGTTNDSKNILFGFIRNIDGNHQWHDLAPPHPRGQGLAYDKVDFRKRAANIDGSRFGYFDSGCTRIKGMRLWVDENARNQIFKKIFKGKIAAGIDGPTEFIPPFKPVLEVGYPELFHGENWSNDGATFNSQLNGNFQTLRISGIGLKNSTVNFSIYGHALGQASYNENGLLETTISLPEYLLPGKLSAVVRNTDNKVISRHIYHASCDGKSLKETLEIQSEIIVKKGDNLWDLSSDLVGFGSRYTDLYEANIEQIDNPNLIYPGQVFMVPWTSEISIAVK